MLKALIGLDGVLFIYEQITIQEKWDILVPMPTPQLCARGGELPKRF